MKELVITLKKIGPGDLVQLREISISTFQDTFSGSNSAGNMAQYIENSLSAERLGPELADPASEFYFACNDKDEVLGYLKLNYGQAQTETQPENYLEVERIYVSRQYQGLKIGLKLMEFACRRAQGLGKDTIWLGVWEHNNKAIRFYQGLGFESFGSHVFCLGDDAQTDVLMKKKL